MFLYGIEVMGDGLKNSSGTKLKRILERVTGNVVIGVLTGTLVTAVIQSSTATIVFTVALVVGIILLVFVKTKTAKTIGDIFIGFGVLFIGLNLMTDGVKPLICSSAFEAFLTLFTNPLFGLVLTVIVQSSSATVGMMQTVASASAASGGAVITFAMAYSIIMGINLGTCVTTAMVYSIGSSKDAKRTGVVHIAFNTIHTMSIFALFMQVMMMRIY